MDLDSLPSVFSRRFALDAGMSSRELTELLLLGEMVRESRSWFRRPRASLQPDQEEWQRVQGEHLDRLRLQLQRFPGHVASHTSAALLHGLAVTISPDAPVELTVLEGVQRSRTLPGVILHHCDSAGTEVAVVDGLRTTNLFRTVADTARTRRLPHSTALVDDALRRGMLTTSDLRKQLDLQKRWRGRPKAVAALALSDPRRETWLESFSFVTLHERGLPIPLAQVDILDDDGTFLARTDGLQPESASFYEADGRGKYFLDQSETVSPEQSVRGRMEAEQRRHGSLCEIGLRGVRWTSDEILGDPESVASRAKQVLGPPPAPVRGYAVWNGERRRLPFSAERPAVDLEQIYVTRSMRERARRTF
ncbi:hypothetical protein [uncultured Serinicoccus sp.]|uniref:hypothetical protein n=1 Tax=uncultured Serinicoccus sp. TaxID=735514 RepID=UPI00261B8B9C|nr:hypothetical protein [uncultured Serinicoccus sp.]